MREAISWRLYDLLYQSKLLADSNQLLGARILLRSAFETLAMLIHLNQLMKNVVFGKLEFHDFSDKTTILLLGSRDGSTDFKSINIVTILKKCDLKYPGIWEFYEGLCESAHPNFDGLSGGYTEVDFTNHVTHFSNGWARFVDSQYHGIALCIKFFFFEYKKEWLEAMTSLKNWIEQNDKNLKKGKHDA